MPIPRGDRRDQGFIIVAVLWILAALATLSLIYSLYVRESALDFVVHDRRLQTEALAESGVELAAYQLTKDPNQQPPQSSFSFRQGSASVAVRVRCENSLIDLNFAPKEVLAGLFTGIGAQPDDAFAFADRIIAWRTPLHAGNADPEAALYAAAGKSYGPRHANFEDANELSMVAGLPTALVAHALPYFTVYSGNSAINVLAAPPSVLAVLDLRMNATEDALKAQLGNMQQYITFDPSKANRVLVDVQLQSGQHMATQATIFLTPGDAVPYRVLSWRSRVPPSEGN
jgi:general secretion pathway protein K